MTKSGNKIGAVIVTYEPDVASLVCLVDRMIPQVEYIVVVDNGSKVDLSGISPSVSRLIFLGDNHGIATAQNIGIEYLIQHNVQDIILFDQDSIPSKTMVKDLLITREQAFRAGLAVAAVGPLHIDQDDGSECIFIDTSHGKLTKVIPSDYRKKGISYSKCDFLIASGCLISVEAIRKVGPMEDKLFIDCVDIEWGFRALHRKVHCIASFNAEMYHKIGGIPLRILGRNITTHSPVRHYYFYRNFFQLLKRPYVPFCWKQHTFIKSVIQAMVFCLFLAPRFQHLKYIFKGVFHGLIGKNGKYE